MNLKSMDDGKLLEQTQILIREEREILTAILHHFKEIDRRRLFAAYGYKSLFDFGVRKLGYSEDQCYRRIQAMRLLKELPEIEEKIHSGELTLKNINLAQALFKKEQKAKMQFSKERKLEVLEQFSNISFREAEKIAASLSSVETITPDRVHVVSSSKTEFKFTGSNELAAKLETLKGLLAHKHPDLALGELIEKAVDLAIASTEKSAPVRKRRVIRKAEGIKINNSKKSRNATHVKVSKAQIRREVFALAQNKCENCHSTYALEIDHIYPKAKGGKDELENFRVLCRSCNQRAAIETLGLKKMETYLERRI